MNENLIRVSCSACQASFRVDPAAIPDEGATATCRRCGRKFYIHKPPAGMTAPLTAPAPAIGAAAPETALYTCPKCGHRQSQPFTCYACGAVITPRKPAPPPEPPPAARPEPVPDLNAHLTLEMGEIVVRTRLLSGRWAKPYTKPRIFIDGMDHVRDWGVHAFKAVKGDCEVAIEYRFLFRAFGKSAMTVQVPEKEKVYVGYDVMQPFSNVPGKIANVSMVESTLWQVTAVTEQPSGKEKSDQKKVIMALIILGPLGLVSLWKSDAFSKNVKIAISAAMVILTLFLLSKL